MGFNGKLSFSSSSSSASDSLLSQISLVNSPFLLLLLFLRVPLHNNAGRNHTTSNPALLTLNSGRTFLWKDTLDDWRKKDADAVSRCSDLDNPNLRNCLSKDKREEATIKAWENLQRAKADAAIRKLEMKLEKKRATSMDKIMNKLKSSQKKAQEMRSSVMANQSPQDYRTSSIKPLSLYRTRHMGSLSGCFTCHAF